MIKYKLKIFFITILNLKANFVFINYFKLLIYKFTYDSYILN